MTAGLLFGTSSILKVSGQTDERIEVGDIIIEPGADGRVEAALKTNAVKPYVGLGFGRSVAHSRVGVKFELGAMFMVIRRLKPLPERLWKRRSIRT